MKKLINVSLVALSLVAIFASASLATEKSADEYEFTALYNDVVIEFPGEINHEECSLYASQQNKIDLALSVLNYDEDITEPECTHPDHEQQMAAQNVNRILEEISFDG